MKEMKKVNRQFLFTLLLFLGVVFLVVAIIVVAGIYIENGNLFFILFASIWLCMLPVVSIFKTKMERITNLSYLIKIMNQPAAPLPIKNMSTFSKLGKLLIENEFTKHSIDADHTLYFKIEKDKIKKIFQRYMLEIVVTIHKDSDVFYLDIVDDEIEKIQKDSLKLKKKIDRMFITQVKEISEMDEQTRNAIKEIVFVKSAIGVISTINVGLHYPSNKAVLLYSDTYSPSLYYRFHIDQIKSIV